MKHVNSVPEKIKNICALGERYGYDSITPYLDKVLIKITQMERTCNWLKMKMSNYFAFK